MTIRRKVILLLISASPANAAIAYCPKANIGRPLTDVARSLVLDDVPVFGEPAVLEADNVNHDPVRGLADARKPAMQHQHVALRHDQTVLIFIVAGAPLTRLKRPSRPGGI